MNLDKQKMLISTILAAVLLAFTVILIVRRRKKSTAVVTSVPPVVTGSTGAGTGTGTGTATPTLTITGVGQTVTGLTNPQTVTAPVRVINLLATPAGTYSGSATLKNAAGAVLHTEPLTDLNISSGDGAYPAVYFNPQNSAWGISAPGTYTMEITFNVNGTNCTATTALTITANDLGQSGNTVPNAATGLTATASPGSTALAWTAPASGTAPTGYKVMRKTGSGAYAQIGNTVAAPATSYNDTTGVAGTAYDYQIITANAQGNGAASNTASATAQAAASGSNPYDIRFIANGTGNSFDPNGTHRISNNFIQQFQDFANAGVDDIRLVVQAGNYNPSPGVFKNAELGEAVDWIHSLPNNPKVEVLAVPIFGFGESRIPENELYCDGGGNKADCAYALNTVPSYFSSTATTLLADIYDSMYTYLAANHADKMGGVVSFAGGVTEEHNMPVTANFGGVQACGMFRGIGDFSQAALQKWRVWLGTLYGVGNALPFTIDGVSYTTTNAPFPSIPPMATADNNTNLDLSRPSHRMFSRFMNLGVFEVWKRWKDKVKQHSNFSVESFVADMYNRQGIEWTFSAGAMHKLMEECDVWYHSFNHHPGDWGHNLVGTDIAKGGTYGSAKKSAIEFDRHDLGTNGGDGPIDTAHFRAAVIKFIEHGGNYIHFAMNFTSAQIAQLAPEIEYIREHYINNPDWTPKWVAERATAPVATIQTHEMFTNSNYIDSKWQSTGNSLSNPLAANIMNLRVMDTFWNTPNP